MKSLTGTWPLLRLIARRDRAVAPIWIFILTVLPIGTASAFAGLYPTEASRQALAATIGANPSLLALLGHIYDSNIGALTVWRVSFVMVGVALYSLFTVIRHTRAEEEAGRRELVGSGVVGRQAALTAALIFVFIVLFLIGAIVALGLIGLGLPTEGALAYGLVILAIGFSFAGISAVCAQLTEGSGSAKGLIGLVLGVTFLLRLIGNAGEQRDLDWVAWLSPLGWAERVRPFAGERYWIFFLLAALVAVTLVSAYVFSSRRDVGAGLLAARPGRPSAPGRLRSSIALAWRLHMRSLIGWCAGISIFGFVVGGVADTASEILDQTPQLKFYLEQIGGVEAAAQTYMFATASIMALIVSVYAVQCALRAHAEESAGRAEPLLATGVSRLRWAAGHLFFALIAPAVVLGVFAIMAGTVYGATTGDPIGGLADFLPVAFAYLPAIWTVAGLAFMLFGLFPTATFAAWLALAFFFIVGQLGEMLEFDERLIDLSPFTHVPNLYLEDPSLTGITWLLVIATLLTAMGLAGLRNRDMAG